MTGSPPIEPDWDLIEVDQLLDSAIIFKDAASRDAWRSQNDYYQAAARGLSSAPDNSLLFEYAGVATSGTPLEKPRKAKWWHRFIQRPENLQETLLKESGGKLE